MHEIADSSTSYAIALFAMFYAHIDQIVSWGGFVLLIVRLIADGPRAYKTLKDKLHGEK